MTVWHKVEKQVAHAKNESGNVSSVTEERPKEKKGEDESRGR